MLYAGIDIGKTTHYISVLFPGKLADYPRHERGPTLKIENSREGFEKLLATISQYGQPDQCSILLERTGHYGVPLEHFLLEAGCNLYHITPKRRYGRDKTDRKDAMALAIILYNHLELRTPVVDSKQHIWPVAASSPAAKLRYPIQRRYDLQREATRRKNQLTSICDQVFPELTQVYKNPNSASALALREQFPTPQLMMAASIEELCATRLRTYPSKAQLKTLQELARIGIGTHDESQILEQQQLIVELRLHQRHIAKLDIQIEHAIRHCREGKILMSIPGIGPLHAATLLASIGCIARFKSDAKLRAYLGWAPQRDQTGSSRDRTTLTKAGNKLMRRTMFLIVCSAVKSDAKWKALYNRLVERKCAFDAEKGEYMGKMPVIGRIAGQLIRVMYVLLKRDYDLLQGLKDGEEPPEPQCYCTEKHLIKG